jgi:hypothetical protein
MHTGGRHTQRSADGHAIVKTLFCLIKCVDRVVRVVLCLQLNPNSTPQDLDMEDEDRVDVQGLD